MHIFYIFCYTLAYLSYLNNMWVPIEKKPAPVDYELKLCQLACLENVATPHLIFKTVTYVILCEY